ncbi:MAG TPA: GNAT family N-acetyltransferase, partial [Caldilineaceae bacterium]|nr:GNAT family N-acetyltransferase [Caldilineaceae bacterium]
RVDEDDFGLGDIEIVPFPTLQQRDPNWLQRLWELDWPITQDVPSFTERTRPTLTEISQMFQQSNFLPNGYVVAIDTQTSGYVGMSQVYLSKATAQRLETGRTGVLRNYRRRGIATAMKCTIIEFALQSEVTTIRTRNEENNPMYALNRRLGFQPLPAWLTYEKIAE